MNKSYVDDELYIDDDACWYDLPGFPNHQGSLRGEIRHKRKHNILKPHIDKDDYQVLSLGNVNNVKVHRVLCEAFYGPAPKEKTQVNHIDCNRQNNHFMNLEWSSPSENIKWGVYKGNIDPTKGLKRASEINPKPVRISETGQVFNSVKECGEYFGVSANRISRVLVGSRKGQKIHGYHIEFANKEV